MNTHDLNASANALDEKNRQALLKVIDLKVEDDMEKILAKIDSKFAKIDSKFEHVESKIATVFWALGISTAVISILIAAMGVFLAIIAFKK